MNADRLLTYYERIADAPNAVVRLRRFILNLAVRGKLVEQDPNDESAPELLKRIAAEKARLVRAGESRKSQPLIPVVPAEQPFAVPISWKWVSSTYPAYGVSDLGKKIKTKDVLESGAFPVVDQGKVLVRGYCNDPRKVVKVSEPLIVFGDHTRETKRIDFDFVVGADGVKILQPVGIDARFYHLALQWLPLESRGYSRHFKLLKSSYIPLPPLAEQHRIVAKVDELMALCDRLEVVRAEREATRDRLSAASLARLNAPDPDPDTFRNHAAFAFENLVPLTTRLDQSKALRQTILNLAVRGKLVEQDPADKPTSELLKRIAKEKMRLVKTGKTKRAEVDSIDLNDAPFPVPHRWVWTRLGTIGDWGSGSTPPRGNFDLYGGGITWIKSGELNDNRQLAGSEETITDLALRNGSFRLNKPGDILIAMYGATIGKVAILAERAVTNQAVCGCTPFVGVFNQFLFLFLLSQREQFNSTSEGGAQPNISKVKIVRNPFPLPPLAEQHRIVAKVDELMALCDGLEARLGAADTTRQRLLETLLYEALSPAAAREMDIKEARATPGPERARPATPR